MSIARLWSKLNGGIEGSNQDYLNIWVVIVILDFFCLIC